MYVHLKKTAINRLDKLMFVAAAIHPLMALPQVYDIYSNQSAQDVSLITWLMFGVIGFVFLSYALVHKIKPLILSQIMWFVVDILVVIGVILYG